jgi:RNA polymerase sigma-70 factor (ECF subfamily)
MSEEDTHITLLDKVQSGDQRACIRLVNLYRPFFAGWARQHTEMEQDAEDLMQEILAEVFHGIPSFRHSGQRGAFRSWLRTIAFRTTSRFWSSRKREVRGTGDSAFLTRLEQLEDPSDRLAEAWDREHDAYLINRVLEKLQSEIEPRSIEIFRRLSLGGEAAVEVARELQMTIAAVYTAKSRVLRRVRQFTDGLLD